VRTPDAEEFAPEFRDLDSEPDSDFSAPFSRGLPAEELSDEEIDDLDIDDIDDSGDLAIEDEDLLVQEHREQAVRLPEEEIDPELEQEIRKEIEEIEALEREMGLRGPVEARPRRGDEIARASRGGRGRGLVKPPIQEIFRRGDEVLIQVIKESIGTKGPTLSTYISIPGRYLVLMPGLNRVGVSRKIVDEGQRRKLREIMHELNPPKGLGFIVRTAGLERTKRELARDLAYLLRLWKVILRRIKRTRGTGPIYQESDMITRTIRDIFTSEIDTIWIDEPSAFERAQEFLRVVMPRFVNRIKLYDEKVPLFHKYGIEDEIAKIQRRHVPLPEGGSIVIDQTEALVAIDVNSGNFRVEDDAERTAYEMNLRAAKEIARQLRLRDLGGVIVNDFIDMREERHRRGVERALRDAIKRDRARTKILRMSAFGLIEMTRQRIRPSLKRSVYEDCSHCAGAGVVKTAESMAIDVMRLLALASHRDDIRRISITVSPGVASYLSNRKRKEIARLETDSGMSVQILSKENAPAEHLQIDCFDANSSEVRLVPSPPPGHKRGHQG
jgi:ribonuclease E